LCHTLSFTLASAFLLYKEAVSREQLLAAAASIAAYQFEQTSLLGKHGERSEIFRTMFVRANLAADFSRLPGWSQVRLIPQGISCCCYVLTCW
jgi:hypothetical protein